jgi:HD-like signal output (HDOD) protein
LLRVLQQDSWPVPALPEGGLQLADMAGRALADVRRLTALVQADRRVETRVLRVAQLSAFQPSSPVTSLGEAIAWLGAGEVAEMAFTALVHGLLFDSKGKEPRVVERWRSSIAAAIWAREIGAVSRRRSPQTYLCTLLHDIGFHLARQTCIDEARRLGAELSRQEEDALVRQFGMQFGQAIAGRWALPAPVMFCVEGWADWTPSADGCDQLPVVHLAHHLAEIVTLQGAEFAREALKDNAALDVLGISPDRFTALLERSDWVLGQVGRY